MADELKKCIVTELDKRQASSAHSFDNKLLQTVNGYKYRISGKQQVDYMKEGENGNWILISAEKDEFVGSYGLLVRNGVIEVASVVPAPAPSSKGKSSKFKLVRDEETSKVIKVNGYQLKLHAGSTTGYRCVKAVPTQDQSAPKKYMATGVEGEYDSDVEAA